MATLLLAAIVLSSLLSQSAEVFRYWPAYFLIAAGVATVVGHEQGRLPQAIRHPERAQDFIELDSAIKSSTGAVLSENLSVLVLNRKPVLLEPFGHVWFAKEGLWSPERLVRDCEGGRFELIVYEHRLRDIPGISACLESHYDLWKTLGPYELFKPRR